MNWINIKDEKPELGTGVLVYLTNGFITVAYRKIENGNFAWQLFGDKDLNVQPNDQVEYWMPLPKAPK